jgi:hypothetical protein
VLIEQSIKLQKGIIVFIHGDKFLTDLGFWSAHITTIIKPKTLGLNTQHSDYVEVYI